MFIEEKEWLRGRDLNPRPLGYEPNELPDCSTPRHYGLRSLVIGCKSRLTNDYLKNPDDSMAPPTMSSTLSIHPTFADIQDAARQIAGVAHRTPVVTSQTI